MQTVANLDTLRRTACLVVNPITVDSYDVLSNCTAVVRASDSVTSSTKTLTSWLLGSAVMSLAWHFVIQLAVFFCSDAPINVFPPEGVGMVVGF